MHGFCTAAAVVLLLLAARVHAGTASFLVDAATTELTTAWTFSGPYKTIGGTAGTICSTSPGIPSYAVALLPGAEATLNIYGICHPALANEGPTVTTGGFIDVKYATGIHAGTARCSLYVSGTLAEEYYIHMDEQELGLESSPSGNPVDTSTQGGCQVQHFNTDSTVPMNATVKITMQGADSPGLAELHLTGALYVLASPAVICPPHAPESTSRTVARPRQLRRSARGLRAPRVP